MYKMETQLLSFSLCHSVRLVKETVAETKEFETEAEKRSCSDGQWWRSQFVFWQLSRANTLYVKHEVVFSGLFEIEGQKTHTVLVPLATVTSSEMLWLSRCEMIHSPLSSCCVQLWLSLLCRSKASSCPAACLHSLGGWGGGVVLNTTSLASPWRITSCVCLSVCLYVCLCVSFEK